MLILSMQPFRIAAGAERAMMQPRLNAAAADLSAY
jgi:hypothetical protein